MCVCSSFCPLWMLIGDSDFTEMDESLSDDSDSSNETDEAKEVVQGKKYLVFESELYKLFTKCPKCYSPTIHIKNHICWVLCSQYHIHA